MSFVAGFTDEQWERYIQTRQRVKRWEQEPLPSPLPLKEFKQTYTNLPVLKSYSGSLSESYWGKWEKRTYASLNPVRSWICPERLLEVAAKEGLCLDHMRLQRVLERLRSGADIGCRGAGRLATSCPNAQGATEFGPRVADSL